MDKLVEFSLDDYIKSLEHKFIIQDSVEENKAIISHYLLKKGTINYEICVGIKKLFEERLSEYVDKNYITEYGVSFMAIGVFRIWFKNSHWHEDPIFLTVNVC